MAQIEAPMSNFSGPVPSRYPVVAQPLRWPGNMCAQSSEFQPAPTNMAMEGNGNCGVVSSNNPLPVSHGSLTPQRNSFVIQAPQSMPSLADFVSPAKTCTTGPYGNPGFMMSLANGLTSDVLTGSPQGMFSQTLGASLVSGDPGNPGMDDHFPSLSSFFESPLRTPGSHTKLLLGDDNKRQPSGLARGLAMPGYDAVGAMDGEYGDCSLLSLVSSPAPHENSLLVPPPSLTMSDQKPGDAYPHSEFKDPKAMCYSAPASVPSAVPVTRDLLPAILPSKPSPAVSASGISPELKPALLFLSPSEIAKKAAASASAMAMRPPTGPAGMPAPGAMPDGGKPSCTTLALAPPHPIMSGPVLTPCGSVRQPILASSSSEESERKPNVMQASFASPDPTLTAARRPGTVQKAEVLGVKKRGRDTGITAGGDDGHSWLKYGEKRLSSARRTRAYFRCSKSKECDCPAKKFVDILEDDFDGTNAMITYIQSHNHAEESVGTSGSISADSAARVGGASRPRGVAVIGQLSAVAGQKFHEGFTGRITSTGWQSCAKSEPAEESLTLGPVKAHPLVSNE